MAQLDEQAQRNGPRLSKRRVIAFVCSLHHSRSIIDKTLGVEHVRDVKAQGPMFIMVGPGFQPSQVPAEVGLQTESQAPIAEANLVVVQEPPYPLLDGRLEFDDQF